MLLGAKIIQFFETPKFFVTILWTHDTFLCLRVQHVVDFTIISYSFQVLFFHPLASLPQAVHAVGVLCIVNDEVARVGV